MLVFKALHLISMVAWFAALFYLPRLFVYHTQVSIDDSSQYQRFALMEKKLYYIIATPALVLTLCFGLLTRFSLENATGQLWPHIKYILVLGLIIYHCACWYFMQCFKQRKNSRTERFFRFFNEVPTVFLISIVLLSVLKPF